MVDCPHRERMGYGGDAHATTETALNSYHLGAFYTKWAQDWRDVQGNAAAWGVGVKAGQSGAAGRPRRATCPTPRPPTGAAAARLVRLLRHAALADLSPVRRRPHPRSKASPPSSRWLAFLESKSSGDMLVRWGGEWDFLGDWLWPGAKGVNGDTPETLFFNNCYWIYNLQTAAGSPT